MTHKELLLPHQKRYRSVLLHQELSDEDIFGGDGTIATNDRDEQRKIIKYNHFITNCLIFHNVFFISRVLQYLQRENYLLEHW